MAELKLHVLDVGQGASAILEFGKNLYGIVDCGGSRGGDDSPVVNFLARAIDEQPETRILFLLITHLDVDHIQAISGLMRSDDIKNRIERLYCNDLAYRSLLEAVQRAVKPRSGIANNSSSRTALSALRYFGELVQHHKKEQDFHVGCVAPEAGDLSRYPVRLNVPGVPSDFQIDLWAPSQDLRDLGSRSINQPSTELLRAILSGGEIEDWNAASIVITILVNGRQVLLAGDATKRTWAEILNRGKEGWGGADVVVAWHHGGRLGEAGGINYDSQVWQRVLSRSARVACISCGSQNRYGHPHRDTIAAINRQEGAIYCTERTVPKEWNERMPKDDTLLILATKSKSGLWVEGDGKCCGDIVVEIDASGSVAVSCSIEERARHLACCAKSSAGSALIAIGGSSP